MRALFLAVATVAVLGLAGCGASTTTMPYVKGKKLDVALTDVKNAGIDDKVKVNGGGTFGIWDKSNWTVCSQTPAAGKAVTGTPTVSVDRSCETKSSSSASASPSETSSPSETPSPSATASASTQAATPTPTPTQPSAPATLTAANSLEFAKVLADPNGDCDNNTKAFVNKYWDTPIAFDGKIADIASHNGDTYVQDVLVYDGKAAVAFQFSGVTIQAGGHPPAALGNAKLIHEGSQVHIVASMDHFNKGGCLVELTPIATTVK